MQPEELAEKFNLKTGQAREIVVRAREAVVSNFKTAKEVLLQRQRVKRITTGSENLDRLLGGGVEVGSITEFFGEYGTGKSQIAHQLCVNVQLPESKGGLERKAIFVDTEGTFRPERIVQMATALGLDPDETLDNIIVLRVYDSEQQLLCLKTVYKKTVQTGAALLVVDSLTNLFRAEYLGREMLAKRQQRLCNYLGALRRMAEMEGVAVVVTNQVLSNPEVFGATIVPVGGNIVAHGTTMRVQLKKGRSEMRLAVLVDSPSLPPGSAVFRISEKGITD